MLAICVFAPGVTPPPPTKFGIVSLDAALALARTFTRQGAVVEIHEYQSGGAVLVKRLEPEAEVSR